jgi:hypothetical protein
MLFCHDLLASHIRRNAQRKAEGTRTTRVVAANLLAAVTEVHPTVAEVAIQEANHSTSRDPGELRMLAGETCPMPKAATRITVSRISE